MSIDKRLLKTLPDGTPNPEYDASLDEQVRATPLDESARKTINDYIRAMAGAVIAEALDEARTKEIERRAADLKAKKETEASQGGVSRSIADNLFGGKREASSFAKETALARTLQYLSTVRGDAYRAAEIADRVGDESVSRALAAGTFVDGGALLKGTFVDQVFPDLAAASTVLNTPITEVSLEGGSYTEPYIDSSATAYWVGESINITASQPTFGQVNMRPRQLSVLVPVSNRLLAQRGGDAERLIMEHMQRVASQKLDLTLLRSTGASNEPMGIRYRTVSDNLATATMAGSASTLAEVRGDLWEAIQNLLDLNVPVSSAATSWIMAPRSRVYVGQLTDDWDKPAFEDEIARGFLLGYKWQESSQIPTNLGGGTNESEVYLLHSPYLRFGKMPQLTMKMVDGAAYVASGSVVSGLARNESVAVLTMECDFNDAFRGQATSVIHTVKWTV